MKRLLNLLLRALLICFFLPFLSYALPPGDHYDQLQLDRIIAHVDRLEQACTDSYLRGVLQHVRLRYSKIGRFDVAICPMPGLAGVNVPWVAGLTLDRTVFDTYPEDIVLLVLVHESAHDFGFGGAGHGHMVGVIPCNQYSGITKLEKLILEVK